MGEIARGEAMREVDNSGNDNDAGLERRPGAAEPGRDVSAPHPDSAAMRHLEATIKEYRDTTQSLKTMVEGLTDPSGNLDLSRQNPAGDYGLLPSMEANHYEQVGDRFNDFDADDLDRDAQDNNNDNDVELRSKAQDNDRRLKLLDNARKQRAKDVKKAFDELKKADRTKKGNFGRALILFFAVAGTAASGVLAYLYITKGTVTNNPPPPKAFSVTDDTVEGFAFGQTAKINVLKTDFGVDGSTMALVGTTDGKIKAASGTVTVPGQGVWSVDAKAGQVIFVPDSGYTGDPDPVDYMVSASEAKDDQGNASTGTGTVTLLYNGDFKVEPILVTTYVKGGDAAIDFLEGSVGADPTTAKLVAADQGDDLTKTVATEGVWKLDQSAKKITFTADATFNGNPATVKFTVQNTAGTRTIERSIILVERDVVVPDLLQKADHGKAFTVKSIAVPSQQFDQATLKIVDASKNEVLSLSVSGEGVWTVDGNGELSFKPDATFKDLPSSINASIADSLGRRSPPFKISIIPYVPPLALNEFVSPPAGVNIGQGTSVTIQTRSQINDIRGDFDIDPTSVQIIGPIPFDGTIPTARFTVANKTLDVQGEGIWNVNSNGAINFKTAASFTRWPTPIAYTVADVEGNISNVAFVWIDPGNSVVDQGMANSNALTDAKFWGDYEKNILGKQYSLSDILVITNILIRLTESGVNDAGQLAQIRGAIVPDASTLNGKLMAWGVTQKADPTKLRTVSAFIDDAYVNGIATGVGSIKLATRILRLKFIMTLVAEVLDG